MTRLVFSQTLSMHFPSHSGLYRIIGRAIHSLEPLKQQESFSLGHHSRWAMAHLMVKKPLSMQNDCTWSASKANDPQAQLPECVQYHLT